VSILFGAKQKFSRNETAELARYELVIRTQEANELPQNHRYSKNQLLEALPMNQYSNLAGGSLHLIAT